MNGLLRMPHRRNFRDQNGLNMVDIMIWLIIAAMLVAAVFQSASPYRQASIIYQMKSDLRGVVEVSGANGSYTGMIQDTEVETAVMKSKKSNGITISWGKFALYAETPPEEESVPEAITDTPMMELVSSVKSSFPAAIPGKEINTYVLVARHPEVPSMRVVYFFDDIHEYKRGVEVISITELPPIQDMFGITPDPSDILPPVDLPTSDPTEPATTPSQEPSPTDSPTEPATTPTETPTDEPSEPVTPEVEEPVTPSPSATAVPTTPAPPPSPAPTQVEPPSPSPSPLPTEKPEDPTPEPNPLTPGDNLNPKTKKFLFCHNGSMHSNSYSGMINGHEHHAQDIMPPIPPLNYPGWNWTYRNAQTFYNNCIPVTP